MHCTFSRRFFTCCSMAETKRVRHNTQLAMSNLPAMATSFKDCGKRKALQDGKKIHAAITNTSFITDVELCNRLLVMYIKYDSIKDAQDAFDNMPCRNLVSWNAIIDGYARQKSGDKALSLFGRMQNEGFVPDRITFVNLLNAFQSPKTLELGKLVHTLIIHRGFQADVTVGNALVKMYAKCGELKDAHDVFSNMPVRNVASWVAFIDAHSMHGQSLEAFKLFYQMQQEVELNQNSLISTLRAFNAPEFLAQAKLLHAHVIAVRIETDLVLGNVLVSMYEKCGSIESARSVFDGMPQHDVVSWTAMIAGYGRHGDGEEAFRFFRKMQGQGLTPNKVTFLTILNACKCQEFLPLAKLAHAHIIYEACDSDVVVATALLSLYGNCGSFEEACRMFENIEERTVISWNAIISVCIKHGRSEHAFKFFQQMQQGGVKPNKITLTGIFNACACPDKLELGKMVHAQVLDGGFELDVCMENVLLNMYGKCGQVKVAQSIFDKMFERNLLSWNSMISAYAQFGSSQEAVKLFWQMQHVGIKPNEITFVSILNAFDSQEALTLGRLLHAGIFASGFESDVFVANVLVNMYAKCGSIVDAYRVFNKMQKRNVVAWNTIINAYSRLGYSDDVFKLFQQLQQEGVAPNKVTFMGILAACTGSEAIPLGRLVHANIVVCGLQSDILLDTALINMYGKCGSIEEARMVFECMPQHDTVSWTAMISAYAQHGHGKEALQLFHQMEKYGLMPLEITMISVLNACSCSGLVDAGFYYFRTMHQDYGITPTIEHYNCIVDLFGRAGMLYQAEEFIKNMPFEPDSLTWTTLLNSCRVHNCIDLGQWAAECALQLDSSLTSGYVMLSNIYAAAGRLNDVANVKKLMAERGIKEEIGCSWAEVNNKMHYFVMREQSDLQKEEIYAELERLNL